MRLTAAILLDWQRINATADRLSADIDETQQQMLTLPAQKSLRVPGSRRRYFDVSLVSALKDM